MSTTVRTSDTSFLIEELEPAVRDAAHAYRRGALTLYRGWEVLHVPLWAIVQFVGPVPVLNHLVCARGGSRHNHNGCPGGGRQRGVKQSHAQAAAVIDTFPFSLFFVKTNSDF